MDSIDKAIEDFAKVQMSGSYQEERGVVASIIEAGRRELRVEVNRLLAENEHLKQALRDKGGG